MSNLKSYRSCFVPLCTNTTVRTPDKMFLCVPQNEKRRKKWFQAAHRGYPKTKSHFFCCEDHFDLKDDMENYIYYTTMGGLAKIKVNVVPHKFDFQPNRQQQHTLRPASEMRCRQQIIQEMLIESVVTSNTLEPNTDVSDNSVENIKIESASPEPNIVAVSDITFEYIKIESPPSNVTSDHEDGPESSSVTQPAILGSIDSLPVVKKIIANVYLYLKKEYETLKSSLGDNIDLSPLANILKRTAEATGVTQKTVTVIVRKRKRSTDSDNETASGKRHRSCDSFDDDDVSPIEEDSGDESAAEEQPVQSSHDGQAQQADPLLETLKVEVDEEYEDNREAIQELMRRDCMEPPLHESTTAAQFVTSYSVCPTRADVKSEPESTEDGHSPCASPNLSLDPTIGIQFENPSDTEDLLDPENADVTSGPPPHLDTSF